MAEKNISAGFAQPGAPAAKKTLIFFNRQRAVQIGKNQKTSVEGASVTRVANALSAMA